MAELERVEAVPHREGRWGWVPYKHLLKRWVVRPVRRSRILYTGPATALYATGLRSTDRFTLPGFLGIGAVKGGTTWLHHNLAAHPDLYLPPEKEIHFFDDRLHLGIRTYAANFAGAGERIPGEITPAYSVLSPARIRFVSKIVPDVRLILLIRDPVERAWSHAVMKLAREHGRRPEDIEAAEAYEHFSSRESLDRGRYSQILARWREHFPEEQLLVGVYDDIAARPKELLKDVFSHIGATTDIDWSTIPYQTVIDRGVRGGPDVVGSSTPPLPDPYRKQLYRLYHDELHWLAEHHGGATVRWLEQASA